MKKKLISAFLFVVILLVIDFLYTKFGLKRNTKIIDIIYFILASLFTFMLIANLLYGALFSFKKNKIKSIFFSILILCLSMFLAGRNVKISKHWFYAVHQSKFFSSNLWQQDKFLGFKGTPNEDGFYEYHIGNKISGKIQISFDSLGYRALKPKYQINSDTLNLFLGCSWTFGDFINSEEGFPYKISKRLNHNFINAGASGYGLSQMIQLIDSLVPKYKFKYVFVQLSPWLSDRGMKFNGPSFYGYKPYPYFSDQKNSFKLNYIPFQIKESKRKWRGKKSYLQKIYFTFTTGFDKNIIDYFSFQMAVLKSNFYLINKPTKNKRDLELFFYNYVIEKCREFNAKPIIFKVGYTPVKENNLLIKVLNEKNIPVIDLDSALHTNGKYLQNIQENRIFHLKNGKKIYYDGHPNPEVNTKISEIMVNYINKHK